MGGAHKTQTDEEVIKAILGRFDALPRPPSKSDRQQIEAVLHEFGAGTDRTALRNIRDRAFGLEKRYIAALNRAATQRLGGERKILVSTLGMSPQPVILDALALAPREVYLLHTKGSFAKLPEVMNEPELMERKAPFRPVEISEDDAAHNYPIIAGVFERARRQEGMTLWADATGGRKMMVASLTLAAFHFRVPLIYLLAPEKEGEPWPFSEELKVVANPYDAYGDPELELVRQSFNSGDFAAAVKACRELREHSRNLNLGNWLFALERFIGLYDAWDRFEHSEPDHRPVLVPQLRSVVQQLGPALSDQSLSQVQRNVAFLNALASQYQHDCKNMCDPYRLVDLIAAAQRRASQRRYDDAVARLYRATEMGASIVLMQHGIREVRKPDVKSFAESIRMTAQELAARLVKHGYVATPGSEALAQKSQFLWLKAAGVGGALADAYFQMESEGVIQLRNDSILAHGTVPLTQEAYDSLYPRVWHAVRMVLEPLQLDASSLLGQATFPVLDRPLRWPGAVV